MSGTVGAYNVRPTAPRANSTCAPVINWWLPAGVVSDSLAPLASVHDMSAVAIRVAAASRGDAAVRARARPVSFAGVVHRPASVSTTRGRRDSAVAFGTLADAAESCDEACTWEQLELEVTEEVVANVMRVDVTACRTDDTVLAALETLVSNRISGCLLYTSPSPRDS